MSSELRKKERKHNFKYQRYTTSESSEMGITN